LKLLYKIHKYSCHQMWANFIVTSCQLDEWAVKPKFLAQSRPGLHYSQQQLDQHRVKNLETSAKFCIEYIIATMKAAIYNTGFCSCYFAVFWTQRNMYMDCFCSKKFEGVYLVKNSQSNLLFSYLLSSWISLFWAIYFHIPLIWKI